MYGKVPFRSYLLLGVSQTALYNGHKEWLEELPSYEHYLNKSKAL